MFSSAATDFAAVWRHLHAQRKNVFHSRSEHAIARLLSDTAKQRKMLAAVWGAARQNKVLNGV
jgi:hypothetical protein